MSAFLAIALTVDGSMPADFPGDVRCAFGFILSASAIFSRASAESFVGPLWLGLLERGRRAKLRRWPDGRENGGEDRRQSRRIAIFPARFDPRRREGARRRAGRPAQTGPARGFWLEGDRLSIIADLRDPETGCDQRARRRIDPEGEGVRLHRVARRIHSGIDGLLKRAGLHAGPRAAWLASATAHQRRSTELRRLIRAQASNFVQSPVERRRRGPQVVSRLQNSARIRGWFRGLWLAATRCPP